MRALIDGSSACHPRRRSSRRVLVDDAVLPAAAHLTGPDARHVLRAALDAAGGRLERARPCHLQYRPGHDVVVRFDGRVRWAAADAVAETLLAATTRRGPPAGTLPVEATDDGVDAARSGSGGGRSTPSCPASPTPSRRRRCASSSPGWSTGRSGSRSSRTGRRSGPSCGSGDGTGTVVYVKALRRGGRRPRRPPRAAARRRRARARTSCATTSGAASWRWPSCPARRPRPAASGGRGPLPGGDEYEAVLAALAGADLPGAAPRAGRAARAPRHAAMLAAVAAAERASPRRRSAPSSRRPPAARPTIASADDPRRPLRGPARHRPRPLAPARSPASSTSTTPGPATRSTTGRPSSPTSSTAPWTPPAPPAPRSLDLRRPTCAGVRRAGRPRRARPRRSAGALAGLATGPFRMQRPRWPGPCGGGWRSPPRLATTPGEKTLSIGS